MNSPEIISPRKLNNLRILICVPNKHCSNMNAKDNNGNTALHLAIKTGSTNCAVMLLQNGCDYEIKNAKGFTAKELAKDHENKEILALMDLLDIMTIIPNRKLFASEMQKFTNILDKNPEFVNMKFNFPKEKNPK